MSGKLTILGGKESGVGAAILGQKQGWEVFVSDFGSIPERYAAMLDEKEIEYEQGGHSEARILESNLGSAVLLTGTRLHFCSHVIVYVFRVLCKSCEQPERIQCR